MRFRTKALARAIAAAIATGALLGAGAAQAGGIITYGATTLGVNDAGELNFSSETGPGGGMTYGVYRNGIGDAISPGCACEGWGVSVRSGVESFSAFANQSQGSGGFTGGTFGITGNTASSTVSMNGAPVTISHFYGPSLQADTFQAQVQITNTGAATLGNLIYRRAMDWDVPPSPFSEYVTHGGVAANLVASGGNVLFASNNGFASSDPLTGANWIDVSTVNTDFVRKGPSDHGSVFDFSFGSLAAGETRIFNIFYGTAATEASARSKIAALGANVFSLGQPAGDNPGGGEGGGEGGGDGVIDGVVPTAPGDPVFGDGTPIAPETFFFAFGGVGGVELGSTQNNPILPFMPAPLTFVFTEPLPRRWFDPPTVEGFEIELAGGGEFLEVIAPDGFLDLKIVVDGVVVDEDFDGLESFSFAPGVTTFTITGISPLLDPDSPGFASAFPLFLDFTNPPGTVMTWTALPVPEPSEWALMLLAAPLLGWQVRRRRQMQA